MHENSQADDPAPHDFEGHGIRSAFVDKPGDVVEGHLSGALGASLQHGRGRP